jgi:hypothetical protein
MESNVNSSIFKISIGLFLGLSLSLSFAADPKSAASAEPVIKKSESGICHDKTSASFTSTKKFTAFASMDECLKTGGRMPNGQAATAEAMVKKSDAGICHDKASPSYERTKNFIEFKSMDECVKSGGTAPKK